MEPPFHLLLTVQNRLFAARGADLYSFDLANGDFVSSWTYTGNSTAQQNKSEGLSATEDLQEALVSAENGSTQPSDVVRPAKRRRLSIEKLEDAKAGQAQSEQKQDGHVAEAKSPKKALIGRPSKMSAQDRVIITTLAATPDGKHLVTVTGLDKIIRVFSHDEAGSLSLLSARSV